jgi:hypothetical protein
MRIPFNVPFYKLNIERRHIDQHEYQENNDHRVEDHSEEINDDVSQIKTRPFSELSNQQKRIINQAKRCRDDVIGKLSQDHSQ